MKSLFSIYHRLPILLYDSSMVALAWALAIVARYGWPLEIEVETIFWQVLPMVMLVQSLVLWQGGLYQGIWRFTSLPDLVIILRSTLIGTLAIVLILVLFNRLEKIPRSSLLFYPFLLPFLLGMPRLLYRLWHEHSFNFLATRTSQRVLVLGAGTSGDMLVRDMLRNPHCHYVPVGFLDDNLRLHGGKVQGIPVLGRIHQLAKFIKSLQIEVIVIAMPSATTEQMQRIVELCERCGVPFLTLPKLNHLVSKQVNLSALREVAIEDLLGRDKIELDWKTIQAGLRGQTIMVSGGGGSIGAELCRQIAQLEPSTLVIIERCEFNLYQIEMQLRQTFPKLLLYTYLGDIGDEVAMRYIVNHHSPSIVFHAAAYKHVPMLQFEVREAVRNNVLGTKIFAEIVAQEGCQTFVLISTDKAVNPSNVMGATKRAAEIFCQSMNGRFSTRFITVRFGNVLGSAGSVVPLFKEQIARGGPLTVTHPEISRYFMTIPEACQLILQAAVLGQGGEIFVLDMGKSVNIRYLAEQMIRLSGKVPHRDIKITYTGLRAGEKLYEELFHRDEKMGQTAHPKILLAAHRSNNWKEVNGILKELAEVCENYSGTPIKTTLKKLVPEWYEE